MIRFLDVTCLDEQVTEAELDSLCQLIHDAHELPAAICVYPKHLSFVKQRLHSLPIGYATVINFPNGTLSFESIALEIKKALDLGATELDIVFPYTAYLQNKDLAEVRRYITRCRQHMGEQTVFKLILETGAIEDGAVIYTLSHTACETGVDYIKTSTGKVATGATLDATDSILRAIQYHAENHQRKVGLKVSGGIKTRDQALAFYQQVEGIVGESWLTPQLFRIGASQLFKTIVSAKG